MQSSPFPRTDACQRPPCDRDVINPLGRVPLNCDDARSSREFFTPASQRWGASGSKRDNDKCEGDGHQSADHGEEKRTPLSGTVSSHLGIAGRFGFYQGARPGSGIVHPRGITTFE